ncbi:MAG: fumarylacetoacetate hydrolase family protein [Calditrichaeota bacterium]|nr:MAG: fumarylacetoacetate hydrolase family protein [Calditrichota bacterium]
MERAYFVNSSKSVPLHSIFCVGRNYARHAAELNNPVPEAPLIFLKPLSAVVQDGGTVVLPEQSREVHHEVEVVALIGRKGKHISPKEARSYVAGYAVGIDLTARDVQQAAKARGHPWTIAKGFDTFAPLSRFVPPEAVGDPFRMEFSLRVNGQLRQQGNTADMLFPLPELIAYLSGIFTLKPGDLIFTGTPEGVGPVHPGDVLQAELEGLTSLRVEVVRAPS